MGFVKTPAEIAALEAAMARREFRGAESLSVRFASNEEVIRSLVPPPLTLSEPIVGVSVSRFRGGTVGPFSSAALTIPVEYEGDPGVWLLTSFYSCDAPVLFGIYTEGAVKKQAEISMTRSGSRVRAAVERHGIDLIRIDAELTASRTPTTTSARTYCLVSHFSPTGVGFLDDPILTASDSTRTGRGLEEGTGTVRLASNPHDPLGDIPVGEIQSVAWVEADHASECRQVTRVPADDAAPFLYARMDDWTMFADDRD